MNIKKIKFNIRKKILENLLGQGEVSEKIKQAIEHLEVEETKECQHPRLIKIIDKDFWYRCSKCGLIIMITDSVGWTKKQIPKLIENLQKGLKLK